MNMFKNLFACAFLALAAMLWTTPNLGDWHWAAPLGPDAMQAIDFMIKTEPFSSVICVFMAVALFMIGKKY